MKGGKDGTLFLEHFHVFILVVRRPVLPAAENNPNPFVGQRANDGVKLFAFGRIIIDVVASPLALVDR